MEQEAKENDKFYVENTSYARNKQTGKDISNYLKTYFVDYYNETQKDKIVTQHTIWHFTDDFDGWRLNYTLINLIKQNPSNYDDVGVKRWNDTHEMVYKFNVLLPMWTHHQNYWAYDIQFREIINNTLNNTINNTINITDDTTTITDNIINTTPSKNTTNNTQQVKHTKLQHYKTGNEVQLLIFMTVVIALIIIKTDYNKK